VIQLQGDQRKNVQEFLTDKKKGLDLKEDTVKVCIRRWHKNDSGADSGVTGPWVLDESHAASVALSREQTNDPGRSTDFELHYQLLSPITLVLPEIVKADPS
jgi:hypothetical protein